MVIHSVIITYQGGLRSSTSVSVNAGGSGRMRHVRKESLMDNFDAPTSPVLESSYDGLATKRLGSNLPRIESI